MNRGDARGRVTVTARLDYCPRSLHPSTRHTHSYMAGAKRNRLKKVFSPTQMSSSPPTMPNDDEDLMDDLMAQLDSRDKNVQSESANILSDMQANNNLDLAGRALKKDPKSRYQARQVSLYPESVLTKYSC